MKAVIHLGLPKTGSSTIKTWIYSNRAALEAEGVRTIDRVLINGGRKCPINCSIYMALREMGVDDDESRRTSHTPPADMINDIYEASKFLHAELKKISNFPGLFVYSNESFFGYSEMRIEMIETILSRYFSKIIYVVYVRDFIELFASLYSENILTGKRIYKIRKFTEALNMLENGNIPYLQMLNFENLFFWDSLVGERLNVRMLESDWLNGDLLEDFASVVGVNVFRKPDRVNESIAAEYVEYIRIQNLEGWGEEGVNPIQNRARVIEILRAASSGKPKIALSAMHAQLIQEHYCGLVERIRKKFFPDRSFLFTQKQWGPGIMPAPLTDKRKANIESTVLKNWHLPTPKKVVHERKLDT